MNLGLLEVYNRALGFIKGPMLKTVNGENLVGTGDIAVGGSSPAGSPGQFQTNGDGSSLAAGSLWQEDTDTVAQRNGASAQKSYLYRLISGLNWERLSLYFANHWAPGGVPSLIIGAESGGTGQSLPVVFVQAETSPMYLKYGNVYIVGDLVPNNNSRPLGGNGVNGGNGWASLAMSRGTTATVGDVTMDKSHGRVKMAAGATSLTVSAPLRVAATSSVFAVIATNDATAEIKNVVPADGAFTINMKTAPTGQIEINYFVVQNGG